MFPSRTNKSGYKNMQNDTETFTCFAILKNILFIYFLIIVLAVPYLCCCMRAFPSCGEWGGLFFTVVHGLLLAAASPVVQRGLQSAQASVLTAHGLSS